MYTARLQIEVNNVLTFYALFYKEIYLMLNYFNFF